MTKRSPIMTKYDIRYILKDFESYYYYFDKCIEYGENDYYDYITIPEGNNNVIIPDEKKIDYIESCLTESVSGIYLFNRDIIRYLRGEPKSYRDYFISELIPHHIETLHKVLSRENIEFTIYKFEHDPDSTHDIYKNLNCLYHILTNVETLIDDDVALRKLLDYNLSSRYDMENYVEIPIDQDVESSDDQESRTDAFTWYGKPSELAALMTALADNGYINTPKRENGERNNEGFSRIIQSHFKLENGSHRSVLNSLKDNSITPNNKFKVVIDKLPKKD